MPSNHSFLRAKVSAQRNRNVVNSSHNPNDVNNEPQHTFEGQSRQGSHFFDHQDIIIPQELPPDRELSLAMPRHGNSSFGGALLISNEKVNESRGYRVLFLCLLVIIAGSTNGVHSVFGTLLMDGVYRYSVKQMMSVYLTGQVFGMFTFPFGLLYDLFGPRVPILLCTILISLGNLLFALMFAGHISQTPTKSAIFYAIMCWGCYGTQVSALPCALTYMPRDRGQPLGFLVTFSNIGASLFACFFRGFFPNHFDRLMWFMFAFCVLFGLLAVWYVEDAPYVTTEYERSRITLKKKVDRYLIRNRYMSQLISKRRFFYFTLCLIALNFYLTIQAIIAGYRRDEMTKGNYRGISIGAVIVVSFTSVLIWPLRCMDGNPERDTNFFRIAKEKEAEARRQVARRGSEYEIEEPVQQPREDTNQIELIEVNLQDSDENVAPTIPNPLSERSGNTLPNSEQAHPAGDTTDASGVHEPICEGNSNSTPAAENHVQGNEWNHTDEAMQPLVLTSREPSRYAAPYFEMINIGHEGFLAPVYEISFWKSLCHLDVWLMFYTTFVMWGIGMTMTGNWNIKIMLTARDKNITYAEYIFFASMSGINMAGGRTFVGTYEQILNKIYVKFGTPMVSTWAYPVASVGMFIAMILWIALPGNYSLVVAYLIGPFMFGMSHSLTFYILGSMFDRHMGMHYSFSFLAGEIGLIVFYYLSWYLSYDHHSTNYPIVGRICIGQRKCMNTFVGICIAFAFSSIFTSLWVHLRHKKLLEGKRSQQKESP
ncbi:unnamed protein product [Phytomonas sp. EM1]|nr:unnamed protein product [Phytomonas sp. EM1]|eukprot:CCW65197.1 unnamed protein product [Phytomonas sp. isolate EM1]